MTPKENSLSKPFNPFHTTGLILHPLENSENPDVSEGIERDQ